MTAQVLGDLGHARAGDKGDNSIILVAPYASVDLDRVVSALDRARVAAHMGLDPADVTVTVHPLLVAVTVVLHGRLQGGVTRSLTVDPHGKTLAAHLLALALPDSDDQPGSSS